jgi:hypothetical protein
MTIDLEKPSKRLVPGCAAASPAVMRVLPHWLLTQQLGMLTIALPPAPPLVRPVTLRQLLMLPVTPGMPRLMLSRRSAMPRR